MAKVQYGGGIVSLTGSVGGNTYQTNKSGYIVRTRGFAPKTQTARQTKPSGWLLRSHSRWQALSPVNQIAWNLYANAHPKTNKYGQAKKLTGLNWYDAVNYQREKMGLSILTSPPLHLTPDGAPTFNILISNTQLRIQLTSSFDFANNELFIWVTPPTTRSTFSINQIRKYCTMFNAPGLSVMDITNEWQDATSLVWNPAANFPKGNIIVQLQPCRKSSGIIGGYMNMMANVFYGGTGIGAMTIGTTFIVA